MFLSHLETIMSNARHLLAFFTLLSFSTSDRLPQICSVDEYTSSFNTTLPVYGSLPWLIYPMSKQQFLTSYYQQIPIYFQRRNHTYYHHSKQNKMNDWRNINRRIGKRSKVTKRYMAARATRTGQDVEPFHYWQMPEVLASFTKKEIALGKRTADSKSLWDPSAITYLYDEGYSLQYPAIEQYYKDPFLFKELIKNLGIYPRLNMYVTPKKNKGFEPHFDSHDVYVLQVSGSKHWKVYSVPDGVSFPVTDWGAAKLKKVKHGKPTIDVILEEGDALYIPRGYVHEADCYNCDQASTHITVGFMTMKASDLIYLSVRESKLMRKKLLMQFKKYLQKKTKTNQELRRSAVRNFCLEEDTKCTTADKKLNMLYVATIKDFLKDDSALLNQLVVEDDGRFILEKGYKFRTKELLYLAKLKASKGSRLSRIRPITHSLQEKRKPRVWNDKDG